MPGEELSAKRKSVLESAEGNSSDLQYEEGPIILEKWSRDSDLVTLKSVVGDPDSDQTRHIAVEAGGKRRRWRQKEEEDGGSELSARAVSEAEEGARDSDGQPRSTRLAGYPLYILHRKQSASALWIVSNKRLTPWLNAAISEFLSVYILMDAIDDQSSVITLFNLIAKALSSCSASTGDIINTTERLKQELDVTTERQEIISALREEDLNENFFKALHHVQDIHANCKILLRTHHQRAGLELMDMMSVYQEGAYERLCRWVQAECKELGDTDNPEVSDLLKTAVRCLKERPVLFKYCAEEVANMRHHALFRRFISALTRGGPGGFPRPIEVHAHDPLRYVGDMLGWLHQAIASERELVLALLDPDALTDTGSAARRFMRCTDSDNAKSEPDFMFVLDRIFEGACRPFKIRVEQVLQSQPSLIVSYKLINTLEFYCYTISDLLGRETALCNTLWLLRDAAHQTFLNILKNQGDKLLRYPPLVAVDLTPPQAVREGVTLLVELIETYNGMMVPASGQKPDFDPVIAALLDPIVQPKRLVTADNIQINRNLWKFDHIGAIYLRFVSLTWVFFIRHAMCEQAAEAQKSKGALSRKSRTSSEITPNSRESLSIDSILTKNNFTLSQTAESSSKIYLINCLSAIEQPLVGYEIASNYINTLHSMIETQLRILVEKEVEIILRRCDLLSKISYIRNLDEEKEPQPLAEVEEMSPQALSDCLRSFYGMLTGIEGLLPEFEPLQVPRLRSDACDRVAKALAEAHELLYGAVVDPKNCYPDPKSLVRHSPEQVRTILEI
ncbi:hypothetical protein AXF42_Ash010351 [Apostasia shenzhenica]|uniref:Conserved Oligomeric Golgi complex subunit 6 C-terminal domain-containing protein n=1 Tax=Apostasia shenzhenica TaxID=1088818 RepID=A0A2I0BDS7_9ASPA|nr:hypothetical protein AXF42_Ash010351 [Apostasia shenzhenica]